MRLSLELGKLREQGYFRSFEDKGDYYLVTCPFHSGGNERTPSMGINKNRIKSREGTLEEGYCHCFGCGYKGRFTKLLADIRGVSEFDILKEYKRDLIYDARRELVVNLNRESMRNDFNFNPKPLTDAERSYLRGRKITDEIMSRFEICSDGRGGVVFPLHNKVGEVIGIQSRNVSSKIFYNTKGLDKRRFLYGLYHVKKSGYVPGERIYVVESIIDMLTLWSWGYKAVALMGAEFSDYHYSELIKLPHDIVLALDNDEVGKSAMTEAERVFKKLGRKVYRFRWGNLPEKDINDLTHEKFKTQVKGDK